MQVIISTEEKREIDYILELVEKSSDAELISRMATVSGKGDKSEVTYIVHLYVEPTLPDI